jgi:hypothetical protein
MNASDVVRMHRNRTLFFYNQYQSLTAANLPKPSSFEDNVDSLIGGQPTVMNFRIMDPIPEQFSERPFGEFYLQKAIILSIEDMLRFVASSGFGPTKTARFFYLWFFTLASGFNWVTDKILVSGTKDTWNWNTKYTLPFDKDILLWMTHLIIDLLPNFIPGVNLDPYIYLRNECFNFTGNELNETLEKVRVDGHWSDFLEQWNTWKAYRDSDGNVGASAVPPDSSLPNGSQTLDVSTTTDDPNDFTDPYKWVPLKVLGAKKNYLTYGWGDVLSSCLTSGNSSEILTNVQEYYPGDATSADDGSARALEIAEVISITGSLTDEQKIVAEFWAGGPTTVTPPGMFIWFWKEYIKCTILNEQKETSKCLLSGFDLAINLFETSRLIWQLKKDNMQARPIQEIRRMYRGVSLTNWDGTSVLGEAWTPFQELDFVTPPFPDFPSGHSGFSQSFANVMTSWFGATIPNMPSSLGDLRLLSPMFQDGSIQYQAYGAFTIGSGRSQIQSGSVPSQAITLSWSSWQSLADSAGISRKYGGIHATSAHTSSQALANALHTKINTNWAIQK